MHLNVMKNSMSAITGIFYRDDRYVSSELIKRMNDSISHRGPDNSKVWLNGPVALGHQMLHTTPESLNEELPFEDPDSGLVITADARIDNRAKLAPLLGLKDVKEVSDSLFILRAYIKWGEECPEKLLGDFAFAIWDPEKELLFCARDHMGIKSFYYYLSKDIFLFGTEIKAIFTIPGIKYRLNEKRVAFHLMRLDLNETFYEGILSLKAGHSIELTQDKSKIRRYWKLNPESNLEMESEKDYIETFREIFAEAVKCRLRSAYPMGFQLSGGLDSSSIVCMAKKIKDNNSNSKKMEINTFSMIPQNFPECDESFYIQKVVETGGINPKFIRSDTISPLNQMGTILTHIEEPYFVTPSMTSIWNMYRKMQSEGTRVFLSGYGGDQIILSEYNIIPELFKKFQFKMLIREIKGYSKRFNVSYYNIFKKIAVSLIPQTLKRLLFFLQLNQYHSKLHILNKKFSNKLQAEKYLTKCYEKSISEVTQIKKFHYNLINMVTKENVLETTNRASSVFSLEPRFPFLDKRLIEFYFAIPTDMKFNLGWNRYLHRVAMEDVLPSEIQWRSGKGCFDPIFKKNLLSDTNLTLLLTDNELLGDYVDLNNLKEIYQKYVSGEDEKGAYIIWIVVLLSLWLNNFQDQLSD